MKRWSASNNGPWLILRRSEDTFPTSDDPRLPRGKVPASVLRRAPTEAGVGGERGRQNIIRSEGGVPHRETDWELSTPPRLFGIGEETRGSPKHQLRRTHPLPRE